MYTLNSAHLFSPEKFSCCVLSVPDISAALPQIPTRVCCSARGASASLNQPSSVEESTPPEPIRSRNKTAGHLDRGDLERENVNSLRLEHKMATDLSSLIFHLSSLLTSLHLTQPHLTSPQLSAPLLSSPLRSIPLLNSRSPLICPCPLYSISFLSAMVAEPSGLLRTANCCASAVESGAARIWLSSCLVNYHCPRHSRPSGMLPSTGFRLQDRQHWWPVFAYPCHRVHGCCLWSWLFIWSPC